jgi:hypothetical protein
VKAVNDQYGRQHNQVGKNVCWKPSGKIFSDNVWTQLSAELNMQQQRQSFFFEAKHIFRFCGKATVLRFRIAW